MSGSWELGVGWLGPSFLLGWRPGLGCDGSMSVAGTVSFTELLVKRCAPAEVQGIDPSDAQLALARLRPAAKSAEFRQGDAMALPFPDDRFDVAVMALVIFFVPDPSKGVAEMARVVCPGGTVAVYAWDLLGGGFPNEPIQRSCAPWALRICARRVRTLRGWKRFEGCGRGWRRGEVERTFKDFDDFWGISALGSSVGPSPRLDACRRCRGLEISCSQPLARRPCGTHHLWRSRQRHQRPHA